MIKKSETFIVEPKPESIGEATANRSRSRSARPPAASAAASSGSGSGGGVGAVLCRLSSPEGKGGDEPGREPAGPGPTVLSALSNFLYPTRNAQRLPVSISKGNVWQSMKEIFGHHGEEPELKVCQCPKGSRRRKKPEHKMCSCPVCARRGVGG